MKGREFGYVKHVVPPSPLRTRSLEKQTKTTAGNPSCEDDHMVKTTLEPEWVLRADFRDSACRRSQTF